MYKIRVILDTEEDVIRDIIIDGNANLEQLHFAIAKAFGFNGQEMASFYKADNQWNQGDEIPLFEMEEDKPSMQTCVINKKLTKKHDKLIYVYDFLEMWTFFVELIDIVKSTNENIEAIVVGSVGKVPKKAPKREFKSESKKNEDDLIFFNDEDDVDGDYSDENYDDPYYDDEY
ncbi:MAG: hypothetical protein KGZ87_09845 [Bacteroidetes bacterium]|nr:hypothetical protein [Bacteroidota bacterium]